MTEVEPFTISVDWSNAADLPTTHVNQFFVTPGPPTSHGAPDGVYLVLGSIPPPFVPGDKEGQRRAVQALKEHGLKVTAHARYQMSRERLEELIVALQALSEKYDEMAERSRGEED